MKKESIHIFSSIDKLADFFAGSISENIAKAKGNRPYYVALSGGSTPKEIFKSLVINHLDEIDWSRVMIFWGDERCVSPASDESNYKMAYESLIKKADIPGRIFSGLKPKKMLQRKLKDMQDWSIQFFRTGGIYPDSICSCWALVTTATQPQFFRGRCIFFIPKSFMK